MPLLGGSFEAAEDAAEEAECAALIGWREVKSAEHEAEVVLVGGLHVFGRVVRREHDLLDEVGEDIEIAGGGAGIRNCGGSRIGASFMLARADSELVEADGGGLTEVHGRLAGVGGDFNEVMAVGEVFAGEAVFLGAEDEGNLAGGMVEFGGDDGRELIEGDDGLLGFAVGECAGAKDEGAVADCFSEGGGFAGVGEEFGGADGGTGFAPVRLVGCDDGQMREAEVGHGAGDGADVEGIARRYEDNRDAIALLWSEQRVDCRACVAQSGGGDGRE